jgi:hypothetical protein
MSEHRMYGGGYAEESEPIQPSTSMNDCEPGCCGCLLFLIILAGIFAYFYFSPSSDSKTHNHSDHGEFPPHEGAPAHR